MFDQQPGEVRRFLEKQTEGRKKGRKAQKAPGSDGGLFDINQKQEGMF